MKEPGAGIYSERPYFLKELPIYASAAAFPFSSGTVGVALNYYGNNDYNQSQAGLAYGKKLSEKIDLGIQFNYHRISISGYGSATTMDVEIGAIIHVTDKVHTGIHITNPLGKFKKSASLKNACINTFGIGYEISEQLLLQMEINKEENKPLDVNTFIHYNIDEQVYVRAGVLTGTTGILVGTGLKWKQLRTDISASYHPVLGVNPCILFIYSRAKK
jgi:hypothetical protein